MQSVRRRICRSRSELPDVRGDSRKGSDTAGGFVVTESRKPGLIPPVALVALLSAAYVGAYFAMAEPLGVGGDSRAVFYCQPWGYEWDRRFNERVTPWFSPLHWFDRRL